MLLMFIYVNYILVTGGAKETEIVVSKLETTFTITYVETLTHYIGVKIDFGNVGIYLSMFA